jgi:hypothetical protein
VLKEVACSIHGDLRLLCHGAAFVLGAQFDQELYAHQVECLQLVHGGKCKAPANLITRLAGA